MNMPEFYPSGIYGEVMSFINSCIITVLSWFASLMESSGMTPFYLAMIFVFLVGRFILIPLFGISAGSDAVRKDIKSNMKDSDKGSDYQGKYLKKR